MKKLNIVTLLLLVVIGKTSAQTGISAAGAAPHASAMLDVSATNHGFLAPRVALVARNNSTTPIASPAQGLLVYNTATTGTPPHDVTPGFYYWDTDVSLWQRMMAGYGSFTTGTGAAGYVTYWTGTTTLGYDNDANGQFYYDAATNRMGVGTATPNAKINIGGIAASGTTDAFRIDRSDGTELYTIRYDHTTSPYDIIFRSNNKNLRFQNQGSFAESMILNTSGNIGLGVTAPTARMDIKLGTDSDFLRIQRSSSTGRSQIVLANESAAEQWRVGMTGSGGTSFAFYDGTQNALTLERNGHAHFMNNGNVGIASAAPAQKLDVNGVINSANGYRYANTDQTAGTYLRSSGTNFVPSTIQASDLPGGSNGYIFNQTAQQASSNFNISGNGTIGSNAIIGTGDATGTVAGGILRAPARTGTDAAGTNLTIRSGNGTGTGGSGHILFQTAPVATSSATANTITERMRISSNGTVGIGTITNPEMALQTRTTTTPNTNRIGIDNQLTVANVALGGADRSIYGIYNYMFNTNALSTNAANDYLYNYASWNQWQQNAAGKARQGMGVYNYAYNNGGELYHSIYGNYSLVRNRGIAPISYGSYSYSLTDAAAGAVTTSYGAHNLASTTRGTATNIYGALNQASFTSPDDAALAESYGAYNYSFQEAPSVTTTSSFGTYNHARADSGAVTTARASYNYVRIREAATATTAIGVDALVQREQNATITNGYLFKGDFSGTIGTKYGIYLTNETYNYFSNNVGIGTATAATPLHAYRSLSNTVVQDMVRLEAVRGDFEATPAGLAILFKDQDGNNATNEARIKMLTVNDVTYGDNDEAASNFLFETTNGGVASDKMIITGRGNIGIGTINPAQLLDVNGVINSATGYRYANTNQTAGTYLRSNGTNFVPSTIQASDLPGGSNGYILNQTTQQTSSNFNISGTGTIGGNATINAQNSAVKRFITTESRTIGGALGDYVYLGTVTSNGAGTYITIFESHHFCGTINSTTYAFNDNYYAGATTDWMQVPTQSARGHNGVQDYAIDVRRTANHGTANLEIRFRNIVAACGGGTANFEIQTNGTFTASSSSGSGATVAGYLSYNAYQFPVSNDRYKASSEGIFIINSGNVGVGSTNPNDKLEVAGGNLRLSQSSNSSNGSIVYRNEATNTTNADWRMVYRDDFQADANSWTTISGVMNRSAVTPSNNMLTNCCSNTGTHRNSIYQKYYNLTNVPHTYIKVKATYCYIDSWDGENGWITAHSVTGNGYPIWSDTYRVMDTGGGNIHFFGSASYSDACKDVEGTFYHTSNDLYIKVGSGLDSNPHDESFAVDNVEIWVK